MSRENALDTGTLPSRKSRSKRRAAPRETLIVCLVFVLFSGVGLAQAPSNDDCANAMPIGVGLLAGQSWSGANNSGDSACDCAAIPGYAPGASLYYSFTAPSTGRLSVDTFGSFAAYGSLTVVAINSGCPADTATELTCNFDSPDTLAVLALDANQTVLIHVRAICSPASTDSFDLNVTFNPNIIDPVNDDCVNAMPVSVGQMSAQSWFGADSSGFTLCGCFILSTSASPGPSLWYSYTAIATGTLTVDTGGSTALYGVDTVLALNSGCPGDLSTQISCDSSLGPNTDAEVSTLMTAGQTVLFQVRWPCAFGNAGFFDLNVEFDFAQPTFDSVCNGDGGNQLGCTACPCGNEAALGTIGGCLNSAGGPAELMGSGFPSLSLPAGDATDLRFALAGAPAATFALLQSGDNVAPVNMMNPCFGADSGVQAVVFDGLRCAVSNTRRHGTRGTDSNGEVGVTNTPWGGEGGPALGLAVSSGFAAGQTRYFQALLRDEPLAVCMRGLNTSQAIAVIFIP